MIYLLSIVGKLFTHHVKYLKKIKKKNHKSKWGDIDFVPRVVATTLDSMYFLKFSIRRELIMPVQILYREVLCKDK